MQTNPVAASGRVGFSSSGGLELNMRKILDGRVFDTETAEQLLKRNWSTYHPNQGGGGPMLDHVRALYRTKKGTLFSYTYDEIGYGRDRRFGVTGLYTRKEQCIEEIPDVVHAIAWCEQERFPAEDVEEHFPIEEA